MGERATAPADPKEGPVFRLHAFLPLSYANGPGARAVVWAQGCTLGCPGCFNPASHPAVGGEAVPVDALAGGILALGGTIEGVTVSGGEPLQQPEALRALLQILRQRSALSVVVFTGYGWREVQRMPGAAELLACVDVLIAGRYREKQRLARGLRGSRNKTVHLLTAHYTLGDLETVPEAEVIVGPQGEVVISGVEPALWTLKTGDT